MKIVILMMKKTLFPLLKALNIYKSKLNEEWGKKKYWKKTNEGK